MEKFYPLNHVQNLLFRLIYRKISKKLTDILAKLVENIVMRVCDVIFFGRGLKVLAGIGG